MSVARLRSIATTSAAACALAFLYACSDAPPASDQQAQADAMEHAAGAEGADAAEIAMLRDMTAGYSDIAVAQQAGYTERITPCWYHRDNGGQGIHYARQELIDGNVSLHEPEIVMYEPTADGDLDFLAVEYIVPFDAWTNASPPHLLGRDFMRNERLGLWVLHVWLGKDNPSGMFADWNPNVSCDHAEESEDRAAA